MRYLCLVYFEQVVLDRMSDDEKRILDRDSLDYDDELRKRALPPFECAVDRQRGHGAGAQQADIEQRRPVRRDQEHLGGFILIEAASMDEAARLASGIPMAKLGSVEVRPIYDIEDTR